MNIFGITGWKNSGKTTLIVKLVKTLCARGYSVSTVKHAHHHFDIDQPGRDSYQHREAGAREVLLASGNRWALMHELAAEQEPELSQLLPKLSPVDIVIIEGYKLASHPKLQVIRAGNNRDVLPDTVDNLVAVASDDSNIDPLNYGCSGPLLDMNDIDALADFILAHLDLDRKHT